MKCDNQTFKLNEAGGFGKTALIVGFLGIIACIIGFSVQRELFYYSYLTAYVFWVAIGLGALFFILLHHLVDATWSIVLRRLAESVMATLPLMAILFIPIYLGIHHLYEWAEVESHAHTVHHGDEHSKAATDAHAPITESTASKADKTTHGGKGDPAHSEAQAAHHELLLKKTPFLNQPFFLIRTAIYFLIWTLLARSLYKTSLIQDEKHTDQITIRFRRISGPGMVLFALTITFAAFDWLMSLSPTWYSTIFGVYFFAGSLLSILAFITLIVVHLQRSGVLTSEISIEHFHDLGKLLFAFTVFWTYIAFSQYFLIWYGNIPEETMWYLDRWEGNWKTVSLILVFGHFVIPFLVLLSRVPKRNVLAMTIMSLWILAIHWVDLYWIIIPNFQDQFQFKLSEFALFLGAFLGVGGIFVASFWRKFTSHAIVPINDPNLKASINFVNV